MSNNSTKNKWLTMSTDVFVDFINNHCILLYNTKTGTYRVTHDKILIKVVNLLYEPKNMGTVEAYVVEGTSSDDYNWALNNNFIVYLEPLDRKPIVFLPILNLQNDLTREDKNGIKSRIRLLGAKTSYISGVQIRLSGIDNCADENKVADRNHAASQYPCPSYDYGFSKMPLETLNFILDRIQSTSTSIVDIICAASYFESTPYESLIRILSKYPFSYRIHMYADDFAAKGIVFDNTNHNLNIEYTFYGDVHGDENAFSHAIFGKNIIKHIYLLYDESDIAGHEQQSLLPVWTGSNIDFFKKNVWLDKHDIDSSISNFNSIFRNQKLNANFFGIIDIDPLGNIFAHGSDSLIANVHSADFSLASVVTHEFVENNTWRQTRNNLKHCKECPLRYICPPVSSPELANKETRMCNVLI